MKPGNPLTDKELDEIEIHFCQGLYGDFEMKRLIDAIRAQRLVLEKLFGYFTAQPLRRVSTADAVRNSELAYLRELVGMEEPLQ